MESEKLGSFSDLLKFTKKSLDNDDMSIPESISIRGLEDGPTEHELESKAEEQVEETDVTLPGQTSVNVEGYSVDGNSTENFLMSPESAIVSDSTNIHKDNPSDLDDLALPTDVNSCLALNLTYQELITEEITNMEQLLAENREKQKLLSSEIEHYSNLYRKKNHVGNPIANLRTFHAPYFKDLTGSCAPLNEDAVKLKNYFHLDPNLKQPRYWAHSDIQKLLNAVKSDIFSQFMANLNDRLCELLARLQLSDDNPEENKTHFEQEVEYIKSRLRAAKSYEDLTTDEFQKVNVDWLKISISVFKDRRDSENCRLMYKNVLNSEINRSKWQKADDEKLKSIVEQNPSFTWDKISQALKTNRNAYQCMERYACKIRPRYRSGPWTKAEDQCLKKAIEMCRIGDHIPWNQVHYYVGLRSKNRLIIRWKRSLNAEFKHGKWTDNEDLALVAAVKLFGKNWVQVSDFMKTRHSQQCRMRYLRSISPTVKFKPWTVDEDDKLLKLADERTDKTKWTVLKPHFPDRHINQLRQRYGNIQNYKHRFHQNPVNDESQTDLPVSKNIFQLPKRNFALMKRIIFKCNLVENSQKKLSYNEVLDYFKGQSVSQTDYAKIFSKIKKAHLDTAASRRGRQKVYDSIADQLDNYILPSACHKFKRRPKKVSRKIDDQLESCTKEIIFEDNDYSMLPIFAPNAATLRGLKSVLMDEATLSKQMESCTQSHQNLMHMIMGEELSNNVEHDKGFPALSSSTGGQEGVQLDADTVLKLKEQFDLLESKFETLFTWPVALSQVTPPSKQVDVPKTMKPKVYRYRRKHVRKPWVSKYHQEKNKNKKEGDKDVSDKGSKDPEAGPSGMPAVPVKRRKYRKRKNIEVSVRRMSTRNSKRTRSDTGE